MSVIIPRRPRATFICTACIRTLTTVTTKPKSTPSNPKIAGNQTSALEPLPTEIPPYPYGRARWYKQSDLGLYGGQRIQFGNNVAEGHGNEPNGVTTRRSWAVNWFNKRLFSKALGRFIQLRVSNRVLRTIDKVGGLDEYLLGEKEGRIKGLGLKGWELRWAVMQSRGMQARFRKERNKLGMTPLEKEIDELETQAAIEEEVDEAVEEELAEEDPSIGGDADQASHLKIRTAPGQHLVLSHKGWVSRIKSTPEERTRSQVYDHLYRKRLRQGYAEITERFNERIQDTEDAKQLTPKEQKVALNRAKWIVRKQIKESADLAGAVNNETKRRLQQEENLARRRRNRLAARKDKKALVVDTE